MVGNDLKEKCRKCKVLKVSEKVVGKMIGNQVFYQDDLEEYQNSMRGRRVFLSNLNWDTNWK